MCFESLSGTGPKLKVCPFLSLTIFEVKNIGLFTIIGIGIKEIGINTESCSDVNGSQEFKCQCKEGFDGKRCEIAECTANYCNNNGLCSINENDNNRLQCECNQGFEGQRCEIDLCDSVACENGSCNAGKCTCNEGYISNENICKETCSLNPCKVFI